jgi:hypothetical protein
MHILAEIWQSLQVGLFPHIEECLDESLSPKLEQLITTLEVVRIETHVPSQFSHWMGRPVSDRRSLARAFVAKAVYNVTTTSMLRDMLLQQPSLRRICGFEQRGHVPSEATFSRAFAEFAESDLGTRVHQELVRVHVADQVVMHVSYDSTEIAAREKPNKKDPLEPKEKPKRGRPAKGQETAPKELTRIEKQEGMSAAECIAELPKLCNVGVKRDAKGYKHSWVGWKTHIGWADGSVPLTVVTTSASLHDSQVAIPLLKRTAEQVISLYDLLDSAYDAQAIHRASKELGHVPIIDPNRRKGASEEIDWAKADRYNERSTAERGNSRLKDHFGCRNLRVRGHAKAHLHIMLGVLALFADQLFKPLLK